MLTLLNPFAPHITEEIWTNLGYSPKISEAIWPKWDDNKLVKNEVEYAIQINNKIVDKMNIPTNIEDSEIEKLVKDNEKVLNSLNGRNIVKVIVIKNRLVNIIAK